MTEIENMCENVEEKVLDEYTYNGKTLRQIADSVGWVSVKERLPELEKNVLVYAVGKRDGIIGDDIIAVTYCTSRWDRMEGHSLNCWFNENNMGYPYLWGFGCKGGRE